MKKPITYDELAALPDGALLTMLDFCNRPEQRGVLPFSRSKLWELVADDMIPAGRPKPGDRRPHPARVWTALEVRAMIAAFQAGTLGIEPIRAGDPAKTQSVKDQSMSKDTQREDV